MPPIIFLYSTCLMTGMLTYMSDKAIKAPGHFKIKKVIIVLLTYSTATDHDYEAHNVVTCVFNRLHNCVMN